MLEQTIERWFDEATLKGEQKGRQKGLQEGRQEGRQEGLQKGLHQGFSKAVALQLQLRFGPVPDWAQQRLANASEEQLVSWTEAILAAKSLQDVFGSDCSVQ